MKKRGLSFLVALTCAISMITIIPSPKVNAADITIPKGAKEFNNHSYMVYEDSITWEEAKEYCKKLGGHLATINSQKEQDFVASLVDGKTRSFWLGGKKSEGEWVWITKEKFDYSNWNYGEPNGRSNDMYLQIYTSGKWDDTYLTGEKNDVSKDCHGFICEWDTPKKFLTLSSDNLIVYTGYSCNLDYNVGPKQNVTYTSDNVKVATVDNLGNIDAKKAGTAIITVEADDGQSKDCLVIVIDEPTKVKLKSTKVTMKKNSKYTLVATIYPKASAEYETVKFKSNNTKVATVNSKGVIKAKKAGACTITVTTSNGKKATCKVIVK